MNKTKIKVEFRGELMTITELLPYSLVSRNVLRDRIRMEWDIERALTQKVQKQDNKGLPSKASVSANETRRKNTKFKMFAQCAYSCNAK